MISKRECEATGGHRFGMPWRIPRRPRLSSAHVRPPADGGPPVRVESMYWEVRGCLRCNHEEITPHGFRAKEIERSPKAHCYTHTFLWWREIVVPMNGDERVAWKLQMKCPCAGHKVHVIYTTASMKAYFDKESRRSIAIRLRHIRRQLSESVRAEAV